MSDQREQLNEMKKFMSIAEGSMRGKKVTVRGGYYDGAVGVVVDENGMRDDFGQRIKRVTLKLDNGKYAELHTGGDAEAKLSLTEDEGRPYICVHAKKGKYECTATSSYGAAKKAAEHWKLKSTAGIDAHLADVKHSTQFVGENDAEGKEFIDDYESKTADNNPCMYCDGGDESCEVCHGKDEMFEDPGHSIVDIVGEQVKYKYVYNGANGNKTYIGVSYTEGDAIPKIALWGEDRMRHAIANIMFMRNGSKQFLTDLFKEEVMNAFFDSVTDEPYVADSDEVLDAIRDATRLGTDIVEVEGEVVREGKKPEYEITDDDVEKDRDIFGADDDDFDDEDSDDLDYMMNENFNLDAIVESILQESPSQPKDYYDPEDDLGPAARGKSDLLKAAGATDMPMSDFENDYIDSEIEDEELGLRFD